MGTLFCQLPSMDFILTLRLAFSISRGFMILLYYLYCSRLLVIFEGGNISIVAHRVRFAGCLEWWLNKRAEVAWLVCQL